MYDEQTTDTHTHLHLRYMIYIYKRLFLWDIRYVFKMATHSRTETHRHWST